MEGYLKRLRSLTRRQWLNLVVLGIVAIAIFAAVGLVGSEVLIRLIVFEGTGFAGKTLWDWLELLIVPSVLAAGALWFNRRARMRDQAIERERADEEALQKYFDTMTTLLLDKRLTVALEAAVARKKKAEQAQAVGAAATEPETRGRIDWLRPFGRRRAADGAPPGQEITASQPATEMPNRAVIDVARVRTVTVLRKLDKDRIGEVLDFLRDADMYWGDKALLPGALMAGVDLSGVDLYRANLRDAVLEGANLAKAILANADLRGTILRGADLSGTDLRWVMLTRADLIDAGLRGATLMGADLRGANLLRADLSRAMLSGAALSGAKLDKADLRGADLSQTMLTEAALRGADLDKADLSGANLWRASFDERSVLPDGSRWTSSVTEEELAERFGVVFKEPDIDTR